MQPIESFGLNDEMVSKLREAGIKELATVDLDSLDTLDLPVSDIVKLKDALRLKPLTKETGSNVEGSDSKS